jgi:Rab-GTPase-TBC domain
VPRTISQHIFFRERYGAGQRLLFQVLHCISLKFPAYGYVQGMAPIAATLLCYFPDEIAFVMLVRLWQDKGLKEFFSPEFDGLMTAFKSLEDTLKNRPVGKKLVTVLSVPRPLMCVSRPRSGSIRRATPRGGT